MNRSFIIIMIPAVFVAAMYVSLGIYPPARVWFGIVLFVIALSIYRVRALMIKRGRIAPPSPPAAPSSSAPNPLPGAPQK